MSEVHIVSPVDFERTRLLSLLRTVFHNGHYNSQCVCSFCSSLRADGTVSLLDLAFIDEVAEIMISADMRIVIQKDGDSS